MAEDSQGTNVPVQATQDPAMPTGDQQVPESQVVEQGAVPETVETPQQQTEEELPAKVQEHNREYIKKLEAEREQLRKELAGKKQNESFFKTIQPQPLPQPAPIIDPYTGQVDERLTALQHEAWEAKQQAAQANQAIVNWQVEQERREAIAVVPELDSNSPKFDEKLHKLTSALILQSLTEGGEQLSYKEAGLQAKELMAGKNVDAVKKQAATEAIQQLTPKEQASLEAVGNPGRRNEVASDLESLRQGTRRGDIDSIVARLKNIPSVGKG